MRLVTVHCTTCNHPITARGPQPKHSGWTHASTHRPTLTERRLDEDHDVTPSPVTVLAEV